MIGTISVEIQAANPSMPLFPLRAFINSPTSLRIRNVPKKIGDWSITKVYVSAAYPDNSIQSTECVLVGGVWVGTIAGSSMAGSGGDGYTVYADGIDENGEPVAGYILGKGQVEILSTDTIAPSVVQYYVHLLEDGDIERHIDGDLWKDAETGAWFIWQDGQAWAVGDDTGLIDELKERVDALDSTTSELSVAVADLNASMEGVGERLDVIDSTVSGLVDTLDVVDGKVSVLESDVEAMAGRIAEIDSSVSQLQANVETLADDVALKANASDVYTKSQVDSRLNDYELKANLTSDVSAIVTARKQNWNCTPSQYNGYDIIIKVVEGGEFIQPFANDEAIGAPIDFNQEAVQDGDEFYWRQPGTAYIDINAVYVAEPKNALGLAFESELSVKADKSELESYATKVELQDEVDEIDSSLSQVSASVTSLSDTKADKVKVEPILDYMTVPISIQPFGGVDSSLQLNSTLMQQDTQKRVWWYADKIVAPPDDSTYCSKSWVVYNPTDDSFVAYKEDFTYSFGVTFPPQDADRSVINGIDNGTPRTDGRPATGYDYWWEYFEDDPRPQVSIFNSSKGMYGSEQIRVKPDTQTWNVVYEDKLVEEYAPLQKFVSYEGDVLVPNQIDSAWVSITPAMARLGLNASYMSQDTQKRVWWSSQVQYEPEPSVLLYIYVVACYDATNDTFKANIWRDQQEGLPQNLSDLGDTSQWGSFTRASGWASWRDFFYNAPEDEYVVSYGQTTNIELFDHAFVKARWGGTFPVVYQGELVNAYATRQYVDEQIGNILTEEF